VSDCCSRTRGQRCRVCRSERRLVLGVIGMVVAMTMADEVSSQSVRRAADATVSIQPSVKVSLRPLDLNAFPATAFADWTTDPADPSR
jgi:hypothetical protein